MEFGAGHYPAMVVLHTGLLAGCLLEVVFLHRPFLPALGWPMLAVVLAAQALRWWCIATLGHQWNTRVVVIPDASRVTGGPYRSRLAPQLCSGGSRGCRATAGAHRVDHGADVHALNAALLTTRIKVENEALARLR